MSWLHRLQTAKWRDMEFLTDSHEAKAGQRLVVHELPGRDTPVVEDLGAKAGSYRVSAYFVGAEYDIYRDAFLAKLRQPGADWLGHPWLGSVWVRAQDWSISESNAEGGMCKVSVEFAPGGGEVPRPQVDLSDVAKAQIDGYVLSGSDFEPGNARVGDGYVLSGGEFDPGVMRVDDFAQFMAQVNAGMDGLRTALARARMPLTMLAQVLGAVDSAKALLAEALSLPGAYATALRSISGALNLAIGDGGFGTVGAGGLAATGAAAGGVAVSAGAAGAAGAADGSVSAGVPDDMARLRVVAALCRAAVPLAGVGASSGMSSSASSGSAAGAAADAGSVALRANLAAEQAARSHWLVATAMQVALADYTVAEVRDSVAQQVLRAVDGVLPQADDAVFEAAVQARAALQQVLFAQSLSPTQTRRLALPVPSVVLAYRMGVDESVLLARNAGPGGVRHPLFVRGVVRV